MALPRYGRSVDLRFLRHGIGRSMPDCMFIGINPLYAVNTLAHLEASPGIRIGLSLIHI